MLLAPPATAQPGADREELVPESGLRGIGFPHFSKTTIRKVVYGTHERSRGRRKTVMVKYVVSDTKVAF